MTDLSAELGRILTAAREASGKSRRELAAAHELSDVTLLEVEHGRANPTLARITELARIYGVELAIVVTAPSGLVTATGGRPIGRAH